MSKNSSKLKKSFAESEWCQSIKKNKWYFIAWFALTLILGLIGVWLPLLNDLSNEKDIVAGEIIVNGSLSTYSIVILIDGVINGLNL